MSYYSINQKCGELFVKFAKIIGLIALFFAFIGIFNSILIPAIMAVLVLLGVLYRKLTLKKLSKLTEKEIALKKKEFHDKVSNFFNKKWAKGVGRYLTAILCVGIAYFLFIHISNNNLGSLKYYILLIASGTCVIFSLCLAYELTLLALFCFILYGFYKFLTSLSLGGGIVIGALIIGAIMYQKEKEYKKSEN